jgi:uncharacterized protein YqgC (DUF456 family)
MSIVGLLVMVVALCLIPFGLPGTWIMVAVLAVGAMYKAVGIITILAAIAIAGAAELLEFVFVKRLNERYGGSRRAFWGAIIGGIVGVIVGLPVPMIGSVIAAFVGSFLGAGIVTLAETRDLRAAHRVGFGALMGRVIAAVVKVFAGLVLLVIGGFALLA